MASTDGIICYGFLLGEVSLPPKWDDPGIEDWWAFEVHGAAFEPKAQSPFDEQGNWNASLGFNRDKELSRDPDQRAACDAYFDERRAHRESVPPLPVRLVNSCHCDHPVWIAAVPGTVMVANRGYPQRFSLRGLESSYAWGQVEDLKEFLETYLPAEDEDGDRAWEDLDLGEPSWWLGSYWG